MIVLPQALKALTLSANHELLLVVPASSAMAGDVLRWHRIVISPPSGHQYLCFPKRIDNLHIEKLVPELAIERPQTSVFSGATRHDVWRSDLHTLQPLRHAPGCPGSGQVGKMPLLLSSHGPSSLDLGNGSETIGPEPVARRIRNGHRRRRC